MYNQKVNIAPAFFFFEVLLIVGIIHGFIITFLVWFNKKKSTSKLLLSFLLTAFNLLCIKILIFTTGLWQTQVFRYFPLALDLAIQPLIWLYISSLIKPGFQLVKKKLLHFIPFGISLAYSLFIYIVVLPEKGPAAKDIIANSFYFNTIKEVEDFLSIGSAVIYWGLGLSLLLKYRQWLYNTISDTDYPTYAWLKNVAVLMGVLIAGLTISILLDYLFNFGDRHFLHWQLFFIYLAALIYYLGFRGYQLPDKKVVVDRLQTQEELPILFNTEKEKKLPEEKSLQLHDDIIKALEVSELYLNPELNLQKLAKEINSTPALVSSVINSDFQKSFRNLINEYRVKKSETAIGRAKCEKAFHARHCL
ncbi:MAG: hypothetical protein WDN26_00605 [Chitinophagaceae bacterium]